jgi:hypothetical protein
MIGTGTGAQADAEAKRLMESARAPYPVDMGGTTVTAASEIADRCARTLSPARAASARGSRSMRSHATGHMPVRGALRELAGDGLVDVAART